MRRFLIAFTGLTVLLFLIAGCDSGGGGQIQPLSGQGGPAKGAAGTPHPMPGANAKSNAGG